MKITIGILVVVAGLIGGLVVWQWQNIRALSTAMRYSKEELQTQIEDQKASIENTLKDYGLDGIMDFTFEEEEAIRRGEITFEEAMEQLEMRKQEALVSKAEIKAEGENSQPSSPTQEVTEGAAEESQAQPSVSSKEMVEQSINQMYALKAKYLGELGKLERTARSEYSALTAEEKKKGGVKTIVSKYMNPGLSLQSQCDKEVEELLSTLKSFLQERKESLEIISVMKAAYEREKELKKAYYLSLVQ